jgi:vitamin B12 transporter
MKKKIFIAAAVFFSSQLHAQDSTKNLNEVFVTANKFPNKTSLTGKVVIVITREQLEKSGSKDLAQVLTEQAGLYVNGANSNAGKDKSVYLRGAKIDYTLITIDGVPVYDPSGIGSNFDIRLIPIDNIERIEILKGSQSTLYGSDAIAGVINIITKRGGKKPLSVAGMLAYGSYNTLHANAALSGKSGKVDYNLGYTYYKTGGINEATDTITKPHVTDKDGYIQNSVYASLGFHPSEKISIQPYIRYTKVNGNIDQGAFTDELDYTYTSDNFQAGLKNEFKLGKGTLNLLYNYNITDREYIDDSVKSRNGFNIYSKSNYKGREHLADVYIVYPFKECAKLTAGIDFRSSNSDQDYHSISVYGPYDPPALSKDSLKQNQLGVYAAMVVNTKNGFNVELGGRLNHHSTYGNNAVFNFNPSFLLKEQWKLFVNISSGYKTPTLYQLYSTGYGNTKLDPEKAITFESGLQFFTKNYKASGRITYFNRSVKDVITFFTDPVTFQSLYINQDKQKDHGIELESSVQLCKSISLKLFYTYTDGSITTKNNGKDTTYFNLIRRPKSSFGLSLGSNITKQLYISTGINAVGNRTDITYDAFFNQVEVTLKSYALWNVYAEYAILKNKLKFFTDLHNITGAKYTESYGFNTMGFNATAGIRFNF